MEERRASERRKVGRDRGGKRRERLGQNAVGLPINDLLIDRNSLHFGESYSLWTVEEYNHASQPATQEPPPPPSDADPTYPYLLHAMHALVRPSALPRTACGGTRRKWEKDE